MIDPIVIAGGALFGATIGLAAGLQRGFNLPGSILGGTLLGVFAPLMFFMSGLSARDRRQRCPWCAEWIAADARICKHCQRDVQPQAATQEPAPPSALEAQPVPDGNSWRCGNHQCRRLLRHPADTCRHCGTVHCAAAQAA